jgi:hypothetical protein
VNASDAKRDALDALEYMRKHDADPHRVFGYVWGTLARIAGTPGAPMPLPGRVIETQAVRS